MKLIAASLGIIQFLAVGVLSEDPNDETNINICLNINIGPGCAGGHCRPPPSNNCNKNTSSGPEIEPEESDLKPTPAWHNPTTAKSKTTTKSKTAKPTAPQYTDDWANQSLLVCYDATCKAYSRLIRFNHWVCLDDYMCHCYGRQPAMKYGPGWMDEPRLHCLNQECANHCRNKGFSYSVCMEHNMCHCYGIWNPQKPITIKPVELQPTSTTAAGKTERPDWENLPVNKCNDCIHHCKGKTYAHGVCADEITCHCYGHTDDGIYGKGWEDDSIMGCDNGNCPSHCLFIGFVHGVCVDSDTCHCFEQASSGQHERPWDDYPVENCSKCKKFCDLMGHTEGFCIDDRKTCHCYSCNPKVPKSGCAEKPLRNCNSGSCSKTCKTSKFMQAFCKDSNTCHCYDHNEVEIKLPVRSQQKLDDLNVKVLLCYKSSCSYYCRMKEYSDGSCTNSTNCLCSWEADGMDTPVKLCNRFTCASFCTMMDYSHGTCTKMNNCQCSGGLTVKRIMRRSLRKIDQKICFDAICKVFCTTLGSSDGACSGKKTCKCGKPKVPRKNILERRRFHGKPLESQTLPAHTRDPLLDKTRDFVVEVCVLALCKQKCKRHNFRKGFCVEAGSKPKCHCYEAKRSK